MFFSPENWVQPITDGIENQIQPPFILYKTKDSDIYGIWFYEEEKCRKIGGTLTKFVAQSEEQRQQQASAGGARKMDLSSLLNKANNKANLSKGRPKLFQTRTGTNKGRARPGIVECTRTLSSRVRLTSNTSPPRFIRAATPEHCRIGNGGKSRQ